MRIVTVVVTGIRWRTSRCEQLHNVSARITRVFLVQISFKCKSFLDRKSNMVVFSFVVDCKTSSKTCKDEGIKLHRYPQDKGARNQWLHRSGRTLEEAEGKSEAALRICSLHFEVVHTWICTFLGQQLLGCKCTPTKPPSLHIPPQHPTAEQVHPDHLKRKFDSETSRSAEI